jgi:hypothetical protein
MKMRKLRRRSARPETRRTEGTIFCIAAKVGPSKKQPKKGVAGLVSPAFLREALAGSVYPEG